MYNSRQHHSLLILLSTALVIQGCSPTKRTTDEANISKKETLQEEVKNTRGVSPRPHQPHSIPATTFDSISKPHPQLRTRINFPKKTQRFNGVAASPIQETYYPQQTQFSQESYSFPAENPFISTGNDSLSTFSIDMDTGSYANIRRMLIAGQTVTALYELIPPGVPNLPAVADLNM